jgi:hypothetical protein
MIDATRTVSVWLANDEPLYHEAQARAREAVNENTDDDALDRDGAVADLAENLKDWIGELRPVRDGLFGELLNDALADVDWHDVADDFVEDE